MEVMKNAAAYWRKHTKNVSIYIEKKALRIGEKCDKYMDNTSARRKYVCEVLLRIPLILIIHQWLLLSPYSNYWIIDIVLFILRYGVALVLTGTWAYNTGVHYQVFTYLTLDIAIAWVRQISYWSYQDEAHGVCHEKNVFIWSDVTESWWIPAISSILIQIVYFCYRPGLLFYRDPEQLPSWTYLALLATLLPDMLSMAGLFTSFMSELSYWIQGAMFFVVCLVEVVSSTEIDMEVDKKKMNVLEGKLKITNDAQKKEDYRTRIHDLEQRIKKRQQGGSYVDRFPGKWFLRDTMIAFGILYLVFAALIEFVIYQRTLSSLFTLETLLEISTVWCTTQVIVLFLSYGLGILSNFSVALCHFFLTTEVNIVEAFDANIGGIVQISALITFTEASILTLEYIEKSEAMKMVAFLSVYAIIFQTLDVLERKIFHAVNSGSSPGISFYLRVGILTGLLVTAPTLSTFIVSNSLDVNPWLLFFASGNSTLIIRTGFMLAECILLTLTWHTTRHLSKLEDMIHYARVSKSFCLIIMNTVQTYCRYICPFFKGWWFFRLCLALFSFIAVITLLVWVEVNRYRSRNTMVTLINNLPDVTYRSRQGGDDEEDEHECAICYSEMTSGKALPCAHAFHRDCLRRWFQVKTVCPFCNTDIKAGTRPGNAGTNS